MVVKIVYYGPALSGKTTNLIQLHDILNPAGCGDLMTLETKGDRTLFFDLLPLMVKSESFENLEKNAGRVGLDFDNLPLVIQFNKRDMKDTISEEEVLDRWRPTSLPVMFSTALYGHGVKETFEMALKRTYQNRRSVSILPVLRRHDHPSLCPLWQIIDRGLEGLSLLRGENHYGSPVIEGRRYEMS